MIGRRWTLMLGLGACITENPGFDETEGAGGAGSSTGAAASSSGPVAPTSSGSSSGESSGSGEAAGDGSTIGGSTSSGDGMTTGTSGDTTGAECVPQLTDVCVPLSIDGTTYLRCEELVTWAEAEARCKELCAALVVFPPSEDAVQNAESVALKDELRTLMSDQDAIEEMMIEGGMLGLGQSPRALWWIGGRRYMGAWTWVDGVPMPPAGMFGWATGDPEPLPDKDQDCAVLAVFGAGAENGRWFDRPCSGLHRYVCR